MVVAVVVCLSCRVGGETGGRKMPCLLCLTCSVREE